jgi:hypothetical protein
MKKNIKKGFEKSLILLKELQKAQNEIESNANFGNK